MLAHLLGTVASSIVTGLVSTGTVLWASAPAPVYREDALTSRYFGIHGDCRKDATGGPFGGPCASIGSVGAPGFTFEGTTTELSLDSANFTIECWIKGSGSEPASRQYFMANWSSNTVNRSWGLYYDPSVDQITFQLRTSASSTVRVAHFTLSSPSDFFDGSAWHHIAAVRNGSTITVYVDGVAGGTTYSIGATSMQAASTSYRPSIGCYSEETQFNSFVNGKIAECRITNGSNGARYTSGFTPPTAEFPRGAIDDPYWSEVEILVGFNGDWGYNFVGSLGITPGDLSYPTSGGTSSLLGVIDANGYNLRNWNSGATLRLTSAPSGMNFGSSDFTMEMLFNYTGATNGIIFFGFADSGGLSVAFRRMSPTTRYECIISQNGTSETLVQTGNFSDTGDIHFAVVREGNTFRWYINGTLADTDTLSGTLNNPTGDAFTIMTRQLAHGNNKGFRIIAGQAIYTGSSITVPTPAQLLLTPF